MWVSYVNGTPKISQIGSLIYGITEVDLGGLHLGNNARLLSGQLPPR